MATVNSIPAAPTIGVIIQPTCAESTGSVILNGLSSTGTWTLTRTPGGTTTAGSGSSTTLTGLISGTYTFTITNSIGCISSATANILINDQPTLPDPVIVKNGKELESNADYGNQWYNSSGLIPGATEKIYKPLSDGNYYVIVTLNGCNSAASNIISFSVGIENINAFKGILIYPNPAKNDLIIDKNEALGPFDFEIVNSGGKSIYHSILFDRSIIDIKHFAYGVYFIRFKKDNSFCTFKFIKE
jgi:hypothetical protein